MKFKWIKIEQYAFDKIRRIVARDNLLAHLDFKEEFNIHTNASNFILGEVIIQKWKPIAFYSRKLTDTQKRFKVIKKDLLIIIKTIK